MEIQVFSNNYLQVNTYFLIKDNNCIIVDPGSNYQKIENIVSTNNYKLNGVILTHAHADHFLSCNYINTLFDVPLYVHPKDIELLYDPEKNLSRYVREQLVLDKTIKVIPVKEEVMHIGDFAFSVLHTPGHTPGGISLYFKEEKVVFSGDTLFFTSIGRSDFPYSDEEQLLKNIKKKLLKLPEDTIVYPGHGKDTTIGKEKKHNPYLLI